MNDLIFAFNDNMVRTLEINKEPWFVAKDVATILEYRNAPDMARCLDDDEKGTHLVRTLGGNQNTTIINESGLYHAVFMSQKPVAKDFRKWVTGEVLPKIRKDGYFAVLDKPEEKQREAELLRETRLTMAKLERTYTKGIIAKKEYFILLSEILERSKQTAALCEGIGKSGDVDVIKFFREKTEVTEIRQDYVTVAAAFAVYAEFVEAPLTRNQFTRRAQALVNGLHYGQKKINGYPVLVFFGLKMLK